MFCKRSAVCADQLLWRRRNEGYPSGRLIERKLPKVGEVGTAGLAVGQGRRRSQLPLKV